VGRSGFMPVRTLDYERLLDPAGGGFDRYPLSLSRAKTKKVKPILNVAGGLNSKTSTTVILFLIVIGLVIPFVTLTQLIGTKWPRFTEKFQPARQLKASWLGELFGDSVFNVYKMTRRYYQMICCVSLLTVYLPTIWVFLLPYWVSWQAPDLKPDHRNSFLAVVLLIGFVTAISLVSAIWLWASIADSWWQKIIEKKKAPPAGAPATLESAQREQTAPQNQPEQNNDRSETKATSESAQRNQTAPQNQPEQNNDRSETKRNLIFPAAIVFGLITLVATVWIGYLLMKIPETSRLFFFFVRSTNLICGVSPLLPIMMT